MSLVPSPHHATGCGNAQSLYVDMHHPNAPHTAPLHLKCLAMHRKEKGRVIGEESLSKLPSPNYYASGGVATIVSAIAVLSCAQFNDIGDLVHCNRPAVP